MKTITVKKSERNRLLILLAGVFAFAFVRDLLYPIEIQNPTKSILLVQNDIFSLLSKVAMIILLFYLFKKNVKQAYVFIWILALAIILGMAPWTYYCYLKETLTVGYAVITLLILVPGFVLMTDLVRLYQK